jgi:D-3-phosphoglycerate dehydrogenase/glyoxylate/hydroxypyruvate reductase A
MAILVLATSAVLEQQLAALRVTAPEEEFCTDPTAFPPGAIEAILAFRLPAGLVPRFPALRFVACSGAGTDEILAVPDLPACLPIVRAVDPLQGLRMAQYVTMMVLRFHRKLPFFEARHGEGVWHRPVPSPEARHNVGIMGHGAISAPTVDVLQRLGFPVAVWTRTEHAIDGITCYAGADGFVPFLRQTQILVCALPLTPATRGLVDASAFAALPRDAFVINVSRGAVVNEADLVAAVESEHLAGAVLDVFEVEPLPPTSPLWRHRRILCTPHVAALPRAEVAAAQFLDNLRRARAGQPLVNVVDRERGY